MSTTTNDTPMADDSDQLPFDAEGEITLPIVEVLTGRGFITGKSGSGKSNSASVLAEELLDRGFPLLIVDTDGEYWGLKEEYEILHVGADEECDLQVSSEHAPKLAELALEDNVPIILDVSGFLDADEGDALVRETAKQLFQREKKLKKPFLMLVEEIHEYIPEGGGLDDTGQMLIRVAKRGRKRGLGLAGMSQRPADVKKDFITQCDWLLWHRLTWENDTDVVRRVVGSDYADAVQDLADGEGFLMADFLDSDINRVQVRRKRTFDAGATPDLEDFERPDLKSVSGDLVDELEEISEREERRQNRIAQLEDRVEELQAEKAELEEELENARDMRDMASQFAEAMQTSGGNGDAASETVDELIEERNDLRSELEAREERIDELQTRVAELEDYERQVEQLEALSVEEAEEAVHRLAAALNMDVDGDTEKWRTKFQRAQERIEELERDSSTDRMETEPLGHKDAKRFKEHLESEVDDLGEKAVKMLYYYMMEGPMKADKAYAMAGGSAKGRYNERRQALQEKGFIEKGEERGIYQYALPDKIKNRFSEHPVVDGDAVEAIRNDVEERIRKHAHEGAES